ncbi:MAG: hypothetical protein WCI73_03005 [Phycisphaerae bacterium]
MKKYALISIAILFVGTTLATAADPPAAPPPAPSTARPGVARSLDSILADLGGDSYETRQQAEGELHAALARQVVHMATTDDPETGPRLAKTLLDQERLIRWVLEISKRPGDRAASRELIRWTLSAPNEPMIRQILSDDNPTRAAGMKALVALKGPRAEQLIVALVDGADEYRSCALIDALFEREPSPELLEALLGVVRRELAGPDSSILRPGFKGRNFSVKESWVGRTVSVNFLPATRLLAKYQSPRTAAALQKLLPDLQKKVKNSNSYFGSNENDRYAGFWELAVGFKSDAMLEIVYQLATADRGSSCSGGNFFYSNRTSMVALFAVLTDQSPADFGISKNVAWQPDTWAVANEAADTAAVAKVKEWWEANKVKKTTVVSPTTTPATTRPK